MSIIYVPRLIETAEQAERLPVGTIAIDTETNGAVIAVALKHARGWAPTNPYPEPIDPYENELMIGDTALVPIEAEEEITRAWDSRKINSRLVTPWESA